MEAGFLNFRDEHFSSSIYDQSNGFDSENSLFGGFMADNSGHFDSELQQIDEPEINRDLSPNKSEEDYHQTFLEWQQHISTLQERDDRSEFLCHPVPLSMPDIFAPPTQIEDDIKSSSIITGDIFPVEIDDKIFIDGNIMNVIKTEVESPMELEDNCINVKEIPETMPVLEAGDLTTLLEQFEVSEAVNEEAAPSILPLPVIEPVKIAAHPNAQIKKDITEVLPKEVVDRIEESCKKKKSICLVPADRMPPCRSGTRMQDAGAILSRTKFLSIVTGSIKGESVQFDHDYCTNTNNANDDKQFVECYKSEQPDYKKGEVFSVPGNRDKWEYSKKDSGLESGEMSDTSEGSLEKSRQCLPNDVDNFSLKEEPLLTIKVEPKAYYDEPVVSILQPLKEVKMEADDNTIDDGIEKKSSSQAFIAKEEPSVEVKPEQKKKKLNLEEYRKRRKNMILSTPLSNNSASRPSDSTSSNATDEADCQKNHMKNAEVQTRGIETQKQNEELNRSSSKERSKTRRYRSRRYSSSSSSSADSRTHSDRRRGRSRRRRSRSRGQRSIWSRSRSRSSSSSYSSSLSSRSRSRSRSRSSKWRNKSRSYKRNSSYNRHSRYTPPRGAKRQEDWNPKEKRKQVEERRVIYVGQIEEGTTKAQLRERFQSFGPIVDISLHFRERGDNYGFVTFAYRVDAYEAVEHGNDNPDEPRYDICFGGRRAFCQQRYSDLDGLSTQEFSPGPYQHQHQHHARTNDSFDILLREAQENIRKRSNV